MKTVIAVLPNYFGGGKRITETLVNALRSDDLRFILVTDGRWIDNNDCELNKIYDRIITLPLVGEHFCPQTTERLAEAIAPLHADILWMIGDDFDNIPRLRSALARNGKIVFHLHSVPYYQVAMKTSTMIKRLREKLLKTYTRRYHNRMRQTLQHVDSMITLCNGYARQLSTEFIEFAPKIKAFYNPANLIDPPLQVKASEIIYLGRLTHTDKRVDLFLKILAIVKPWQKGWHVNIIGDGPERKNLECLSAKLKLQNVNFLGFQAKPDIARSAIICLTSAFEGWGMSLIEGMAYKAVPIAFGCTAGVTELLADGRGIAVKPGDINAYAQALNELMDSPELREQMAAKAKPFLESLSIEHVAKKWKELFGVD